MSHGLFDKLECSLDSLVRFRSGNWKGSQKWGGWNFLHGKKIEVGRGRESGMG